MYVQAADRKIGRDLDVAMRYKGMLEAVGFVNVQQKLVKVPVGAWPTDEKHKKIGRLNLANGVDFVDGLSKKLLHGVAGMPMEEVVELDAAVKVHLLNPAVQLEGCW